MLVADDDLKSALRHNQSGRVSGIAIYGGNEIPVQLSSNGDITFDASGEVQSAGSVTAIGVGDSLVPHALTDPLAPFGQELAVNRIVRVRASEWSIPLGVFRITAADNAVERMRAGHVLDWSVDVSISDRFEMIRADDFLAVETPLLGNAVWDEVRRLSPIPVQEALGDAPVPRSTVYESRLEAITTLLAILGGVPHMTREGVLTARMADAGLKTPTSQAAFDIEGTIDWEDALTNDFYNQVQVTGSNDSSVVAYAQIDDDANPLSVGRAGGRTYKYSDSAIVTADQAQAQADLLLRRFSSRRARTMSVTCTPEALLLELGDVGWFRDPVHERAVFGEVTRIGVPNDTTRAVAVDVYVVEDS